MKSAMKKVLFTMGAMLMVPTFSFAQAQGPATAPAAGARGGRPPITYLPINPNLPTLWIIGDSTVRNGSYEDGGNGQWGWGNPIRFYFDETKINIQNRAMGGTSSHSYQEQQNLWPTVLPMIKPGDYLIAQFGHNDAGTPKGNSDETVAVAGRGGRGRGPATAPGADQPAPPAQQMHTFGWFMRKYVTDARSKGAVEEVICSPIPRDRWTDGKIPPDAWTETCKEAATTSGAKFIDLNALIRAKYEPLGQAKVAELYFPENEVVHTDWAGAILNAECVIEGLKQINSPLVQYLKPVPPTGLVNPRGKAR